MSRLPGQYVHFCGFPNGARAIKLQWHHKLIDQFQIEISNVSKHSKK